MWRFLRRLKVVKESKLRKRSERERVGKTIGFHSEAFMKIQCLFLIYNYQLSTLYKLIQITVLVTYLVLSLANLVYAPIFCVNLKLFSVEDQHFLNNVLFFVTPA